MRTVERLHVHCLLGLTLCAATSAQAGGFYVPQKGPGGVSLASAGDASRAEDASTVYLNPAGMVLLPSPVLQGGVDSLVPKVNISDRGSTAVTPGTLGAPLTVGGREGDAGKLTPVPSLYYSRRVADRLWAGIAVTAPFGLGLDYAGDWFGRYDSIKSKLLTIDAAPTLAYAVTPTLSIGAGVSAQYATAELTNAIPNTLNPGGPTAATDGFARLKGDGWAWGFNAGVHFHPSKETKVGAHYRSGMKHKLDGDATVSGLTGPLAAGNGTFTTTTEFRLPAIASLSASQVVAPGVTVMAELQWFNWSAFDAVYIKFANGAPDAIRRQGFRDSYAGAVGVQYKPVGPWTYRAGVRYDQTPTTSSLRNTSIPDSTIIWFGAGVGYQTTGPWSFDAGFLHAHFRRTDINLDVPFFGGTPVAGTVTVRGRTDNYVNTFSVAARYQF
jgi:long-chain fatty acid transport protein